MMDEQHASAASTRRSRSYKDRGYAWVVLAAAFGLSSMTSGTFVCYGIFFPEYVDYFGKTKAQVSIIGSLGMGLGGIAGVFLGSLAKRFGYRVIIFCGGLTVTTGLVISSFATNLYMLYITHGACVGIGLGCYNIGIILSLMDYFDKRRSLALGLHAMGLSAGVFIIPPFVRYVIDEFTWKGALLIYGGVQLHSLILAALMRPSSPLSGRSANRDEVTAENTLNGRLSGSLISENNIPEEKTEHTNQERRKPKNTCHCSIRTFIDYTLLKDIKAVILFFSIGLCISGHFVPYLLLPARTMSYGVDKSKATFLISIVGICSGCSRPLFGWLGDKLRSYRTLLVAISSISVGILAIVSYFFTDYISLAVIFALAGFLSAGYISLNAAVMADVIPANKLEHGTGMLLAFFGVSVLIATPFAGYLVDSTNNYATPFLVLGGVQVSGGFLALVLFILQRKQSKVQKTEIVEMGSNAFIGP